MTVLSALLWAVCSESNAAKWDFQVVSRDQTYCEPEEVMLCRLIQIDKADPAIFRSLEMYEVKRIEQARSLLTYSAVKAVAEFLQQRPSLPAIAGRVKPFEESFRDWVDNVLSNCCTSPSSIDRIRQAREVARAAGAAGLAWMTILEKVSDEITKPINFPLKERQITWGEQNPSEPWVQYGMNLAALGVALRDATANTNEADRIKIGISGQAMGMVAIRALANGRTASEAKIYEDGKLLGTTAEKLEQVATGLHAYLVKLEGYQDRIVSVPVVSTNLVEVKVELKPKRPDEPMEARKRRIIVLPCSFPAAARSVFRDDLKKLGIFDPTLVETPGFTGHLNNVLVHSQRFDVLERECVDAVMREQKLGDSDYTKSLKEVPGISQMLKAHLPGADELQGMLDKIVRVGKILNADFIVVPQISLARITVVKETRDIPFTPKPLVTVTTTAKLDSYVRLVDVRTSRLLSSHIGKTFGTPDPSPGGGTDSLTKGVNIVNDLFRRAAVNESVLIVDEIYPIRVVDVTDNKVIVNRGQGMIAVGDTLTVFQPGKPVVDPDTKEILGYNEKIMGQVKITEVLSKMARAEAPKGGRIHTDCYCRRDPPDARPKQ